MKSFLARLRVSALKVIRLFNYKDLKSKVHGRNTVRFIRFPVEKTFIWDFCKLLSTIFYINAQNIPEVKKKHCILKRVHKSVT